MIIPAVDELGADRVIRERPVVLRIYYYLHGSKLSLDEYTIVKCESLSREVGCYVKSAGQALRILVERGYLLKKPLDGRTCMYKLAYRRSVSSSERVAKPTHLSD